MSLNQSMYVTGTDAGFPWSRRRALAIGIHGALFAGMLLAVAPALAQNQAVSAQTQLKLDIPAGSLDSALLQLGRASGRLIVIDPALTQGLTSAGLRGTYTTDDALQTLLAGHQLRAQADSRGYHIARQPASLSAAAPKPSTTPPAPTRTLDTLRVTAASRTPTSISEIPGTVWVVDQAHLDEQMQTGVTLKEALGKLVPGLDLAPEGRTNYGQNMRGRSVLVMIDGVSQNSSRGLSRQFDSISASDVERVEVLSGASSLYGGGATGGIVNIITKKGSPGSLKFESQAGITSGFNASDDYAVRASQAISGGNDRINGRLGVSVEKNHAFYDGKGDQIFMDNTQTDLQYNRTVDVLGTLRINFTDTQTLDLLAQYYDSGFDGKTGIYFPNLRYGTASDLNDASLRKGYSSDVDPGTRRVLTSISYHDADLFGQEFYLQGYFRKENDNFSPFPYYNSGKPVGSKGVYFSGSEQNIRTVGLKALFAKRWKQLKLNYGVDLDHERFSAMQNTFDAQTSSDSGGLTLRTQSVTPRYPGYTVDGLSTYVQGEWYATDALTFSGGARHQRMDVDVNDFKNVPGGSNDYKVNLFNFGSVYDFAGAQQLWANYSEGFELPDPAKYYGKAGISVAANPLAGIKSRQFELGWRYRDVDWQAQVAAYYIWSDKSITVDAATLTINVVNDKTRDYGIEGALTRSFDNGWQAGTTLHLTRSQEKDGGDWVKRDVSYASLSKATAFAGWQGQDYSARLQGNHAFNLKDDSGHSIEGYTTFDLVGSRQTRYGSFELGIQNLLDRKYSTVWGQRAELFYSPIYGPAYLYDYQGRGRTFTLTWKLEY